MFAAVAGESWTLEKLSGDIRTTLRGETKRARPGTRDGVLALCASYPVKPGTGTRLTNLLSTV